MPVLARTDFPDCKAAAAASSSASAYILFFYLANAVARKGSASRISLCHIQQREWHQFTLISHQGRRSHARHLHHQPAHTHLISAHLCISGFSVNLKENRAPFLIGNWKTKEDKLLQLKNSSATALSLFCLVFPPLNLNRGLIEHLACVFYVWGLHSANNRTPAWVQPPLLASNTGVWGAAEQILDGRLESQLSVYCQKYASLPADSPAIEEEKNPSCGEGACVWEAGRQTTVGLVEVGQLQPVAKLRLHSWKGENCPLGRNTDCISSRRVQYILVLTSVIFFTSLVS